VTITGRIGQDSAARRTVSAPGQQRQGGTEHRQQPRHLAAPATRHQHQHLGVRGKAMGGAEPGGVAAIGAGLQYRVADEGRGQAVTGEEFRLERQQAEQALPQPRKFAHPVLPPGPDLRCHVVHPRNARPGQQAQQAQGKAGAVDRYQHVGPAGSHVRGDLVQAAAEMAQPRQHFQQPHHRQVVHREQRLESVLHHARAADAGEAQPGAGGTQSLHQAGAENVATLLASDEVDQGIGTCRRMHAPA
jgi:hypothetical protein